MRVGILALLHESNTFVAGSTTLEHFRSDILEVGSGVRDRFEHAHHEVGGFFAGLAEQHVEAVPIFAARAVPYGTITADAFDTLLGTMLSELNRAGPLDGLLVAPHGATVSARHRDADGYWLSELRRRVGSGVPIVGTLDPHGNLSAKMVQACDGLLAYRTNPHLDQHARGVEAAILLGRTLRGDIRPTMAASFPPVAINIERQQTSEMPCAALYQLADEMLRQPGVLSNSVMLGFPYADVVEMGSSFIVVTNGDQPRAQRLANELAAYLWENRFAFEGQFVSIQEALDSTAASAGPICLLDMGDNVGGGSPADGTFLAHAIHERRMGRSFFCLCDPEAVRQAMAAGVGAQLQMAVGGKTDQRHGTPLSAPFTVLSLHDGRFREPEPRHGGFADCDQGPTAIVRTDHGLTIMLTSKRMPPFSLRQLTSCGLDPASFHILVAKGVIAPAAAYAPVCSQLIRVNTPGITTADMTSLEYKHRRQPLFPFERGFEWQSCS